MRLYLMRMFGYGYQFAMILSIANAIWGIFQRNNSPAQRLLIQTLSRLVIPNPGQCNAYLLNPGSSSRLSRLKSSNLQQSRQTVSHLHNPSPPHPTFLYLSRRRHRRTQILRRQRPRRDRRNRRRAIPRPPRGVIHAIIVRARRL